MRAGASVSSGIRTRKPQQEKETGSGPGAGGAGAQVRPGVLGGARLLGSAALGDVGLCAQQLSAGPGQLPNVRLLFLRPSPRQPPAAPCGPGQLVHSGGGHAGVRGGTRRAGGGGSSGGGHHCHPHPHHPHGHLCLLHRGARGQAVPSGGARGDWDHAGRGDHGCRPAGARDRGVTPTAWNGVGHLPEGALEPDRGGDTAATRGRESSTRPRAPCPPARTPPPACTGARGPPRRLASCPCSGFKQNT